MALLDTLLGQRPSDVKLPEELDEVTDDRRAALRRITQMAEDPSKSAAVQALKTAARTGAEDIERRGESAIASARGNPLLAARRVGASTTRAQQQLAGDVAQSVGQLSASERDRAQQMELAALGDIERAELQRMRLRESLAAPGALDVFGTVAGGAIGGGLGGQQGAAAGGRLGQALGQAFERRR